jgi:hypothetical protein
MAKIKLDHTRLDTPAYIARMREISAALAVVPVFAPLAPKLAPFNTLVDELEDASTAYVAAVQAAKTALATRDAARVAVEEGARGLALGAESETSDDADLQAGGWHLRGAAVPVGPMTAPQNLAVNGGDMEGEVDLSWEPVYGRDTYLAEYATGSTGPWTQFYVGKKSMATAGGLVSGTAYWFRVRAVGAAGPGPWSDVAQKRAT